MSTATLALSRIEYRSDSVMAKASETVTKAATAVTRHAKFYQVFGQLKSLTSDVENFVAEFGTSSASLALETASVESRDGIVERMASVNTKIVDLVAFLRSAHIGFWAKLYLPVVARLEKCNNEFGIHIEAIRNSDAVMLLSTADQVRFVNSILNPPAPNERLSRLLSK